MSSSNKGSNEKIDFGASVPEVKSHEQLVIEIVHISFLMTSLFFVAS